MPGEMGPGQVVEAWNLQGEVAGRAGYENHVAFWLFPVDSPESQSVKSVLTTPHHFRDAGIRIGLCDVTGARKVAALVQLPARGIVVLTRESPALTRGGRLM